MTVRVFWSGDSAVAGVAFSSSEPEEMTGRVKNDQEFPERRSQGHVPATAKLFVSISNSG